MSKFSAINVEKNTRLKQFYNKLTDTYTQYPCVCCKIIAKQKYKHNKIHKSFFKGK